MNALVTGGAGFIGSHLVDALVAREAEVVVLDDLSTGREANLADALESGARLIPVDVTDAAAVTEAIGSFRPDRVFHLAAQVDVRVSVADPGRDARVNVEGTVNLLEAARRTGCESFVLASSCAAYGDPEPGSLPLPESAPLHPDSPYGQGKLAAEGYAAVYRKLHGLRAASLRFANVYGPRQGAVGEAGVVSIFCRELAAGGTPTVFGSGEQTRDFVHVSDVVAAMIAAGDRGFAGELNVGTSLETSVLALLETLAEQAGRPGLAAEMRPPREGEVERMALDCTRARQALEWVPRVPLDEGLAETYQWTERERRGRAVGGLR